MSRKKSMMGLASRPPRPSQIIVKKASPTLRRKIVSSRITSCLV